MDKFDAIDAHVSIPVKFSQIKRSLESYVLVCVSGLGNAHRWMAEARRSIKTAQRYEFELDEKFERHPELCPNVIRWFSLRHNQFFKNQRWALNATDAAISPLSTIWDEILLDCWTPPPLPTTYKQVATCTDDMSAMSNLTGATGFTSETRSTGSTSNMTQSSGNGKRVAGNDRSSGTAVINTKIDSKVNELAGVG